MRLPSRPQIAASDQQVSDSTQAQLTKSFASAEAVAAQHPQYADAIVAGAKEAFLQGDDWAYAAGVVAILLGGSLVYFMFPRHRVEESLLASYHEEDTRSREPSTVLDAKDPAATVPPIEPRQ